MTKIVWPCGVDIYVGDGRTAEQVADEAAAGPPWNFFMAKATEGLYYRGDPWFDRVWNTAHGRHHDDVSVAQGSLEVIQARLGVDWWVLAYDYWKADQDSKKQAEVFCREISRCGGWTKGTAYAVLDFERGGQRVTPSAQKAADGLSIWADFVKRETGRDTVLYTGEYSRSIGLRLDMTTCKYAWIAAYTSRLYPKTFTPICPIEKVFAWQYCGDGETYLDGYPEVSPMGKEDISTLMIQSGKAMMHLQLQGFQEVR